MAANDEILGISGHLDIDDIQKSIDELLNNLDKIGVKTDTLSKQMSDAMRQIASSTDDSVTKQKKAMEVLEQGYNEAKAALANYPEQLRLAKNEMEQTELATSKLEKEFANLNTQLQNQVIGSDKFNELKNSMAGVEQQIQNNHRAYEAQLTTVQEMEAGYNGLVSMMGAANIASAANAVTHGSVAATTAVEAAAHANNAEKIGEETQAVSQNISVKESVAETDRRTAEAIQMEISSYDGLLERIRSNKISAEEYTRTIEQLRNRIAALKEEQKPIGERYDIEAEKVNQTDVIDGKLVSQGNVDVANELAQQYNILNEEIKALQSTLGSAEEAWSRLHNTATEGAKETTQATNEVKDAEQQLNQEASKEPTGFKAHWNAVNELHDKIISLTKELRDYETEYDAIAEKPGFDEQSKKAQELLEKIAELKKQISETKEEMNEEANTSGGFLAKWKNAFTDWATGSGKFQDSLVNMKGALGGILGPFTAATNGALAFGKALWAMAATPIGAVLSAIVLALQALFTWFKKDAEGQRAFAKISAYLGSILSSIMDIAVKIGKYLYHAFADPQGAMNQFGRGMIGLVVNPLKAIAKTLSGVGQIAKGVFDLLRAGASYDEAVKAVDEIKKGWEDLKKAGQSTVDTLKSGWDMVAGSITGTTKLLGEGIKQGWMTDLGSLGSDMLGRAAKAAELADRETEAHKALSEAKRDEHLLDIEIAKEREKIYMLTGKEKDAQIEKVKNMLKEKYEPQIKAQKSLLEIQKERNKLHTVSLEQLAKEREAQGAVYALQARAAASTRMLVRMQQANLRSMANADKKDSRQQQRISDAEAKYDDVVYKNAFAQAKAEQKIEEMITDARISAMKEGTEKYISEKNRAFEKELQQLDEQRKAAIEAERARQKAEFEALENIVKARGGKPKQWDESMIDKSAIDKINQQYETLANLTKVRQINDDYQKQIASMQDYLLKYGDFQQQKLAITEKYAELIKKAQAEGNMWQAEAYEQQSRREISAAKMQDVKSSMDWEGIFNNLDQYSEEFLSGIRSKLQELMKDESIDPSDKKVVAEKIAAINDMIVEKSEGTFHWINNYLVEQKRLQEEAEEATTRYNNAVASLSMALFNVSNAQSDVESVIDSIAGKGKTKELFGDASNIKSKDADNIFSKLGIDKTSKQAQQLREALTKLSAEEADAAGKAREASDAEGEKNNKTAKANVKLKDQVAGFLGGLNDDVQKYLGDLPGLLDKLGLGEAGEKVSQGLSGVNDAAGAASDFATGNYIGAVSKGISAIQNFGSALGIFGSTSNHDDEVKKREELKTIISDMNEGFNRLENALKESFGSEAIKNYEEALEYNGRQMDAAVKGIQSVMHDDYGNDEESHEFFDRWYTGQLDWLRNEGLNMNTQKEGRGYYYGIQSILEGNDPEKIAAAFKKMRDEAPDLYYAMFRDKDFGADLREWTQMLIEFGEQAQKTKETLYSQLTGTTKENVFETFLNDLTELANGVDGVTKNIEKRWKEMVNQMTVKNLVGAKVQKELEEWYNKLGKIQEEKSLNAISDEEYRTRLQNLKKEYDEIVREGKEEIEVLRSEGIIHSTEDIQQDATFNSAKNITYEQADSLVGIETGQQVVLEQSLQQHIEQTRLQDGIFSGINVIQLDVAGIKNDVAIIVETQQSMNNHLADISRFTSVLPDMQEDLYRLRKTVEAQ